MKQTTLLFLIKKDAEVITDVCLAMKKRGFGIGRYNGVGGKVEENESIEDAVRRETFEEIMVKVKVIRKYGELSFAFPHKPDWNQVVHVYCSDTWEGCPTETEEMNPEWFTVEAIPYSSMWPDDIFWLPKVLEGEFVRGSFVFSEGDSIVEQEVSVVEESSF